MTTPIEEAVPRYGELFQYVNDDFESIAAAGFNAGLDAAAEEVAKCQPSRPGLRDAILKRKL